MRYWIVTGSKSYYGPYGSRADAELAAVRKSSGFTPGEWCVEQDDPKPAPPLVWSSEPPKVLGWYWIDHGDGPVIEWVDEWSIERCAGNPERWNERGSMQAGPIPEPVEPEGGA